MDRLNQANVGSGPIALLKFIYAEFPPKNVDHKMLEGDMKDTNVLKKIVVKAIQHYHPDKQVEHNDNKWSVLCTEITKMLNAHYEKVKMWQMEENEEKDKNGECDESCDDDENGDNSGSESKEEEEDVECSEDDDDEEGIVTSMIRMIAITYLMKTIPTLMMTTAMFCNCDHYCRHDS